MVRNSGAGARVVTFQIGTVVDGQAVVGRAVSLAAGVTRYFGPFPTNTYSTINLDVEHAELKLLAFRL